MPSIEARCYRTPTPDSLNSVANIDGCGPGKVGAEQVPPAVPVTVVDWPDRTSATRSPSQLVISATPCSTVTLTTGPVPILSGIPGITTIEKTVPRMPIVAVGVWIS